MTIKKYFNSDKYPEDLEVRFDSYNGGTVSISGFDYGIDLSIEDFHDMANLVEQMQEYLDDLEKPING